MRFTLCDKNMIIFDVALLIILAGFVFYGLFFGLIRAVGSILGVIIGVWLASLSYLQAFSYVQKFFVGREDIGRIITFFVLFILISKIVGFVFMLLDKTFDFISIIPFLGTINRLAGAIFGLLTGALILGLIFFTVKDYPFVGNRISNSISKSKVVPYMIKAVEIAKPILPGVLNTLKNLV